MFGSCIFFHTPAPHLFLPLPCRTDLPSAGLANITATTINLLGYEAPSFYEASLV